MKILTIFFGILLILLGIVNYLAASLVSLHTFMPVVWGVVLVILGIVQGKWSHKHPLYGSLVVAVLAFLGALRGPINLFMLLTGGEPNQPATVIIISSIIAALCVVFVALGIILIKDFWTGWKAFGHFMGDMVARIVLTIFYFTVLVPFGIGVRLFSDPLKIKVQTDELWRSRSTGDQKLEEVLRQF